MAMTGRDIVAAKAKYHTSCYKNCKGSGQGG